MHNPYATTPAGQAATGTTPFATPEDARLRDYDDAIGPNSEYYRPRFEAYDARGSGLSWHWPAFFATSAWFVYRKLYLIGILNFFWPWILIFVAGLLIATKVLSSVIGGSAIILLSPVPWIVLTLTANRIYWRRIKRLIDDTPAYDDPVRRSRELERVGGVARGPMAAMVVFTVLYGIGMIGVLAAIAIPAYQDYTIRAQVTEGLNLASPLKNSVAEYHDRTGAWPHDVAALNEATRHGRFVKSVMVDQGTVVITYGGAAHPALAGHRLNLQPGLDKEDQVRWTCGYSIPPYVYNWAPGPRGADIDGRYLPRSCRGLTFD